MTIIDIEKKLGEILFRRGYILSYNEIEPSSPEDMYEIIFFLDDGISKSVYRNMFIRNEKYPRRKAFSLLLDEIIDNYYETLNVGKKEDVALSV